MVERALFILKKRRKKNLGKKFQNFSKELVLTLLKQFKKIYYILLK